MSMMMLLSFLVVTPNTATAQEGEVLKIGAIPDYDQSQMEEAFGDFAEYLGGELGIEVEFVPSVDYAALVTAFSRGEIHLAWFGGLTFVQASSQVPEAQALAQRPADAEFQTVFIKQADLDEIEELEDLADYTFTFGSESSTSGHVMPRYFLQEAGINPDEDFDGAANYSGSHDQTYNLVQSGAFEAGALNYQYWDRAVEEGTVDTDLVVEFYRSPEFYDYNWTANANVDEVFGEGTIEKIQEILLNTTPEDTIMMELLSAEEFIETENEHYEIIRQVATEVGIIN